MAEPPRGIIDEYAGQILHPEDGGRHRGEPIWLRVLGVGVQALSARALVWVVALAACVGWGWTIMEPTVLRIISASAFCISTLVPILVRDTRG